MKTKHYALILCALGALANGCSKEDPITPAGCESRSAETKAKYNQGVSDATKQNGDDETRGYNDAQGKLGYGQGKSDGLAAAYNNGYNSADGYKKGYNAFYEPGHQDGLRDVPSATSGATAGATNGQTDGHNDGYGDGYTAGYYDGDNRGISDGYDDGYTDGYNNGQYDAYDDPGAYCSTDGRKSNASISDSARKRSEQEWQDGCYQEGYKIRNAQGSYNTGYNRGKADNAEYQRGYAEGLANSGSYASGVAQGYADGKARGYSDGFAKGKTEIYNTYYSANYNKFYNDNYNYYRPVGYNIGVSDGYADGYNSQYDPAYSTGYSDGVSDYCYAYNSRASASAGAKAASRAAMYRSSEEYAKSVKAIPLADGYWRAAIDKMLSQQPASKTRFSSKTKEDVFGRAKEISISFAGRKLPAGAPSDAESILNAKRLQFAKIHWNAQVAKNPRTEHSLKIGPDAAYVPLNRHGVVKK